MIEGIVLPAGWQERVAVVDNANTSGFRGLCLNPTDLAVSKLAAGRPKDVAFVRLMLGENLVRSAVLRKHLLAVPNLDDARRSSLQDLVKRLAV